MAGYEKRKTERITAKDGMSMVRVPATKGEQDIQDGMIDKYEALGYNITQEDSRGHVYMETPVENAKKIETTWQDEARGKMKAVLAEDKQFGRGVYKAASAEEVQSYTLTTGGDSPSED